MKVNLTKLLEAPEKVRWIKFCRSLFPGYRGHAPEESQAYSDFIDSFFEEVDEPDKNSSAYFSGIEPNKNTSSDRAYSFELEKGAK